MKHLANFNIDYIKNPVAFSKLQNFSFGDYNLLAFLLNKGFAEASEDFRCFIDEEVLLQTDLSAFLDYFEFVKKLSDKRLLLAKISFSLEKKERIFDNFSRLSTMFIKYVFVFSFCFFVLLFKRNRTLDGDFKALESFSG